MLGVVRGVPGDRAPISIHIVILRYFRRLSSTNSPIDAIAANTMTQTPAAINHIGIGISSTTIFRFRFISPAE